MFFKSHHLGGQKGQALLIVVLVMVIALTVGMAVATRAIVNLRNTSEQASSQKALAAAEAGVEQALKNDMAPDSTPLTNTFGSTGSSNSSSYTTSVSAQSGNGPFLLKSGGELGKNEATYIWVKDPSDNFAHTWSGYLTLYWGGDSPCPGMAALEVSIIYNSKNMPKLERFALDPCAARANTNHFTNPIPGDTTTFPNTDIAYHYQIDLHTTPVLLIRINPIYGPTQVGVVSTNPLPTQGKLITSTGKSGTTGQDSTRKITVFEGFPEVPAEFFPYNLLQP